MSTLPTASLLWVTACWRSCCVPTLSRGRETAAYDAPPSARKTATEAITFGNVSQKDSRVARLKLSDRNYEMLQELNVRPRTTYLARLKNTNEEVG